MPSLQRIDDDQCFYIHVFEKGVFHALAAGEYVETDEVIDNAKRGDAKDHAVDDNVRMVGICL